MTTLNLQVGASSDDAREDNLGAMSLTSTYVAVAGPAWWGGARFTNVTIPQAATINSATLSIYLSDLSYDSVYADFYCEDIDDAPTFTTTSGNISGRTLTSAYTSKSDANAGTGWYTVDMTSAVQEVIDRGTWASGYDLAVIVDGQASVALRFDAYDGTPSQAAKLDIEYTWGVQGVAALSGTGGLSAAAFNIIEGAVTLSGTGSMSGAAWSGIPEGWPAPTGIDPLIAFPGTLPQITLNGRALYIRSGSPEHLTVNKTVESVYGLSGARRRRVLHGPRSWRYTIACRSDDDRTFVKGLVNDSSAESYTVTFDDGVYGSYQVAVQEMGEFKPVSDNVDFTDVDIVLMEWT